MHRFLIAAVFAGLVTPSSGIAQFFARATPIRVYHMQRKVFQPPYDVGVAISDSTAMTLPNNQSVSLQLMDRNPLLFAYKTETAELETADHKAAAQFATAVSGFANAFKAAGGAVAGAAGPVIEGLDVKKTLAGFDALNKMLGDVPSLIRQSTSSDSVQWRLVRAAVKAWHIDEVSKAINNAKGPATLIVTKCLAAAPGTAVLNTGAGAPIKCTDAADAGLPTIQQLAEDILILEPGAAASLTTLTDFTADASHVGESLELATLQSSLADQVVTVTVTPVMKYQSFYSADDSVKGIQTNALRKFGFVVKTTHAVHLTFGPAFLVRFLQNRGYSAVKQGDAYLIQRSDEGGAAGYNLAAMLNIVPSAWTDPAFGGYFQLGIDPAKDATGLYAGAGVTVENLFSIGAGFAWQQVTRLAPGLAEGQTISAPDLLKIKPQFRPGGYIAITLPVLKK